MLFSIWNPLESCVWPPQELPLLGLCLVCTQQRLTAIKLSAIPARVPAWTHSFPLLLTQLIVVVCAASDTLLSILQGVKWSGILVCRQKTFRAERRKHHCSENLNWQPLFIVFFQRQLFFRPSEINYQLLTLSTEWWFCCNNKKIFPSGLLPCAKL